MIESVVPSFPAPWSLRGKGYILIYKFNRDFVEKYGNVPDFLQGHYVGGFGSVMLVDYLQSDAGPYGELLFIPGKFDFEGKRLDTISKIYVSSAESVVNGRANWGIPKEQAEFEFEQLNRLEERIRVSLGGTSVAEFVIRSGALPFPVSTKLLPFPLIQRHEGKHFYTTFSGSGTGRFAKIEKLQINSELFPDISLCKPIAAIKVEPFAITFPEAVMKDIGRKNDL